MREMRTIEIQRFLQKATYNAWEKDFATLNIFFGQETVLGKPKMLTKMKFLEW